MAEKPQPPENEPTAAEPSRADASSEAPASTSRASDDSPGDDASDTPADATPASPTDKSDKSDDEEQTPSQRRVKLARTLQVLGTFMGFCAGLLLGPYAEELLTRANPGFFGPDNQQIIEDQRANFAALEDKLKALRLQAGDDPAAAAMITELEQLIAEQKRLATRKDEAFKATDIEKQSLSDQLLAAKGHTTAVDFWLAPGESVILKDADTAFTVVTHYTDANDINVALRGVQHRLEVGDVLPITIGGEKFVVIYREGSRASDGRYGFDFAKATNEQPVAVSP